MNKPDKRASQFEIFQRREIIMQLLLSGASRAYIVQAAAKKFSCSERTIDKDIKYCREQFKKEFAKLIEDKLSEYDAKLLFIYERCITQNELHTAFKIIEYLRNTLELSEKFKFQKDSDSQQSSIDILKIVNK